MLGEGAIIVMFGEKLMKKCTSLGCRDLPGLPRRELYQLKTTIFRMFFSIGKYQNSLSLYGQTVSIACKRFR